MIFIILFTVLADKLYFDKTYSLHKVLGKGGFGTVYAASRKKDGKPLAVKHIARSKVSTWKKVWNNQSYMY